jgi:hypothetical protein
MLHTAPFFAARVQTAAIQGIGRWRYILHSSSLSIAQIPAKSVAEDTRAVDFA